MESYFVIMPRRASRDGLGRYLLGNMDYGEHYKIDNLHVIFTDEPDLAIDEFKWKGYIQRNSVEIYDEDYAYYFDRGDKYVYDKGRLEKYTSQADGILCDYIKKDEIEVVDKESHIALYMAAEESTIVARELIGKAVEEYLSLEKHDTHQKLKDEICTSECTQIKIEDNYKGKQYSLYGKAVRL